ncbi:hypothetical protein D050_4836B, partial [Vibrio parahaemolyticus VPCR-2009]
DRTV